MRTFCSQSLYCPFRRLGGVEGCSAQLVSQFSPMTTEQTAKQAAMHTSTWLFFIELIISQPESLPRLDKPNNVFTCLKID